MTRHDVIIVGAGPAGLATAGRLRQLGLSDVLVLERSAQLAAAWRGRYDGFRLNTSRWFSHLPGLRIPGRHGLWPTRDAMVEYFDSYAAHHRLEVAFDTEVRQVDTDGDGWRISTDKGVLRAAQVVIATGNYRTPDVPSWPGLDEFTGAVVHSRDYRNAEPFRGMDVLVVGAGSSGADIAVQLAHEGAARVRIAIRTPPHLFTRRIGPLPVDVYNIALQRFPLAVVDGLGWLARRLLFGDLEAYGLGRPPHGVYTQVRRLGRIPTVSDSFVDTVRAGGIEIVGAVERLTARGVVLADGSAIEVDAIVVATGYRRDLEPLVGHLGVLDAEGRPRAQGGVNPAGAPGLYFPGFGEPFTGPLRELRLRSRDVADAIIRRSRRRIGAGTDD
ncbi:flavin-containing monooxygenase [Nocardia sp. CDC160]|uniref:flavin-containing monooxygenase n=1 Tax=Nocardia sp. CDC160 TaxID=3112166 RepID=UPI002DBF4203|nr:NAD(P)/FAD-dependent oxidoreductase [Nocardia sp. CDC160]MEC3917895.1 NAD(P)/FAD-dependent oxidoreductase [Nocardia sp. CDC160]